MIWLIGAAVVAVVYFAGFAAAAFAIGQLAALQTEKKVAERRDLYRLAEEASAKRCRKDRERHAPRMSIAEAQDDINRLSNRRLQIAAGWQTMEKFQK